MKSLLMIGGSMLALGSAALFFTCTESKLDEDEKSLLLNLVKNIKAEYIPIYAHAYNMYTNSLRELMGKPGIEEFIK